MNLRLPPELPLHHPHGYPPSGQALAQFRRAKLMLNYQTNGRKRHFGSFQSCYPIETLPWRHNITLSRL